MTPELPRAPRSRALAVAFAATPTAEWAFFPISSAAAPMVMDILVPVSPSGTGKTLSSLISCFRALIQAEPWTIMRANRAPSIVVIMVSSLLLSR